MKQSSITQSSIEDQVRLPIAVALQVVLQGLRIRMGRSLVTVMGVVLGIAFLMSNLTSQMLRRGVSSEQDVRQQIDRMRNFLEADMGPTAGKTLGLVQTGPLRPIERRFLDTLATGKGTTFNRYRVEDAADDTVPQRVASAGSQMTDTGAQALVAGSKYVLVMGEGEVPPSAWQALRDAGLTRLGSALEAERLQAPADLQVTSLARQLRPDELAKLEAEKRKARFRGNWIVLISLLVTVIGIANAMLMSVTERFREIGTMKCLGALSAFIRQIFLFESCLIGAAGGIAGALIGGLFAIVIYMFSYGFGVVGTALAESLGPLLLSLLLSFLAGVVLSVVAALYPANVASKMVPAHALRSNV